ncbi:MAG: NACHT domain-containing protein [Elainellaceae cyanobacterium]
MSKRSLKASVEGAKTSRRVFERRGWTQENLAAEVNLKTRQPIWRFFTGRPIERHTFIEICDVLDLNWWEVADELPESDLRITQMPEDTMSKHLNHSDPNQLVQQVRLHHHDKIQAQCGHIVIFNSNQIWHLDDIYVNVNFLRQVRSQRWFESDSFHQKGNQEPDHRNASLDTSLRGFNQDVANQLISTLQIFETHSKLRILGKPGSGKTTVLQHLALQCIRGRVLADQIPIFVTLEKLTRYSGVRDDFNLFDYLCKELQPYHINSDQVESLLQSGKFALFLDGLDEISDRHVQTSIAKEIDYFSDDYYRNTVIITCRTGAQTFQFLRFKDFEISDLTPTQIDEFATKWSRNSFSSDEEASKWTQEFIDQLNLHENWQIKDLVRSPLLLSQICVAFQRNQTFLSDQDELYQHCLNILLFQWDQARGIQRYTHQPTIPFALELSILNCLAADTLKQKAYLFSKRNIDICVEKCMNKHTNSLINSESLLLERTALLESMIAHHGMLVEQAQGIYSFANAAFHEHFALQLKDSGGAAV